MNVEIGTEAAQFPEKGYIHGIFFAVCESIARYCNFCISYSLSLNEERIDWDVWREAVDGSTQRLPFTSAPTSLLLKL
jgi:hypothetical protein